MSFRAYDFIVSGTIEAGLGEGIVSPAEKLAEYIHCTLVEGGRWELTLSDGFWYGYRRKKGRTTVRLALYVDDVFDEDLLLVIRAECDMVARFFSADVANSVIDDGIKRIRKALRQAGVGCRPFGNR